MSSEYIIGRNPVIEALRAGRDINKILVAEGAAKGQVQIVLALAKENKVILQHAPKKKLDQLVEGNHQGVIAQVAAYQYAELEDLFKLAEKRNEDPFFLILDEIEDPHNLRLYYAYCGCNRGSWGYYSKKKSCGAYCVSCESVDWGN